MGARGQEHRVRSERDVQVLRYGMGGGGKTAALQLRSSSDAVLCQPATVNFVVNSTIINIRYNAWSAHYLRLLHAEILLIVNTVIIYSISGAMMFMTSC